MSEKNIQVRLLQDNDIDQVNALHNRFYKDSRTRNDFDWEFKNAPAGKAIYVVAVDLDGNKIVGTQCAIPIYLVDYHGDKILSAKSEDTLVDPDYRGLRIFENMYELLFDECEKAGIQYIWGFTPALKPFKRLGFELPYAHEQSLLVFRTRDSYLYLSSLNPKNGIFDKIKIQLLVQLSRIKAISLGSLKEKREELEIKFTNDISSDLNGLLKIDNTESEGLFSISLEKSYLDWRINQNPYHQNVASISFYRDNKLICNVLFNHHKDGVWYLIHATFESLAEERLNISMLKSAINILRKKERPSMIRTWDFDTNFVTKTQINYLKKSNFIHLNRGVHFVWKALANNNGLIPTDFVLSRMATQGVI